jgi:hypothetical protein
MARLLTSGFSAQSAILDGWNNTTFLDGSITYPLMPTWGSFLRSMKTNTAPSASASGAVHDFTGAANRTYSWRFYIYAPTFPASTKWGLFVGGTNATDYIYVYLTSTGTLQLWNAVSNTQIGSDSFVITNDKPYRIEVQLRIGTGSTDQASLYVAGVQIATSSSLNLSDTAPNQFFVGIFGTATETVQIYFASIAFNDDQGANQTDLPGVGRVLSLLPISDNARSANWLGGAGGTTNLFDAVNNTPAVGVASGSMTNTSQIKNSASDTTGNYDTNLQTYKSVGIDLLDKIALVQPIIDVGCSSATSTTGALFLTSNPAEGAETSINFSFGAIAGSWPTNWVRRSNAVIYTPTVTKANSPVLRVGKRQSTTRIGMVDYMGLIVDYVPFRPKVNQVNQSMNRSINW